jgi:hypothetical protein
MLIKTHKELTGFLEIVSTHLNRILIRSSKISMKLSTDIPINKPSWPIV